MNIKITTKALDKLTEEYRAVNQRMQKCREWAEKGLGAYAAELQRLQDRAPALKAQIDEMLIPLEDKADAALKSVNGRAEAFTVVMHSELRKIADRAEERLADVTLKNRVGATVVYRPEGPTANRYKYAAKSTCVTLRRVTDGWRLVGVEADKVYPKTCEHFQITISKEAEADIIRNAMDGMRVVA